MATVATDPLAAAEQDWAAQPLRLPNPVQSAQEDWNAITGKPT